MDARSVYTVSVLPPDDDLTRPDARGVIQKALVDFILDFHIDNTFIYRSEMNSGIPERNNNFSPETRYERTYW